jgi:hypothetical protein
MATAERVNNERKTRGRPFQHGNPGRPVGSRNKRTLLAEQIMGADLEAVVRAVSHAAQNGDMQAAKIILDRLAPIRRGRPVQFEMPATLDGAGLAEAFTAILRSMAEGELTPEEGTAVASVLEIRRKAIETSEIEARLAALEEVVREKRTP